MTTQAKRTPCGDDIVLWPNGTTATVEDIRNGGFDWMSDDYEIIAFDDAETITARGIEIG